MNYLKAGAAGLLSSLVVYLLIMFSLQSGLAPFDLSPSAAFLTVLNIPAEPWAVLVHFAYGAFWAVVVYVVFRHRLNWKNAVVLAVTVQWLLLMMLVYSPIIGWGTFGTNADTTPDAPLLALNNGVTYVLLTLALHIIYGAINGWLIPRLIKKD